MTLKVKNIKFTLLLSLALVAVFAFKPGNGKGKVGAIKIIVIDAGHGGKDPGCNGVTSKEKDISLSVALKLGKLIFRFPYLRLVHSQRYGCGLWST